MKLSIIVPVYNSEKYLENTIDSVLSQSFTDWQLILVNDGSTDRSLEICQKYATRDSRICVYTQTNAGPSAARNTGILNARGEYIMFLDSDDEYLPGALESVYNIIEEKYPDIVVSSATVVNGTNNVIIQKQDFVFDRDFDSYDDFLTDISVKRVGMAPWRFIIKKSLIIDNSVFFPTGIHIAEDCLWINTLLKYAETATSTKQCHYKYFIRAGSITNTMDFGRMQDLMSVADRLFSMAQTETGELKRLRHTWCCVLTNHMMQNYSAQPTENKETVKNWVKSNNRNFSQALKTIWPIKLAAAFIGNFNAMLLFAWRVKIKVSVLNKG